MLSTRRTWTDACEGFRGTVRHAVMHFEKRLTATGKNVDDVIAIIMRMMQRASSGDPRAATDGRYGLMQLSPGLACALVRELGLPVVGRLSDPTTNIMCAVAHFTICLEQTGSYRRACAAYHWGLGQAAVHNDNELAYPESTKFFVEQALDLPLGSIPRYDVRSSRPTTSTARHFTATPRSLRRRGSKTAM